MKSLTAWVSILALAASAAIAQQPNSPQGSLKINGVDGPAYPIVGVFVYGGTNALLKIDGGANVLFVLAQSQSLTLNGVPFQGGLIDLDLVNHPLEIVEDGFGVAPWKFRTDSFGHYSQQIAVPSIIESGTSVALQAAVQNPSTLLGVTLTGATSIITAPGLTPLSYNLGNDNCLFQNTSSQFGFNIPFYATSYTGCWICANGFINFGAQNTGFTPTDSLMHTQQARIAPFWTDLDPSDPSSGPVTLIVDQTALNNPVMTFKYTNVADWPVGATGGIGHHTIGARIDIASGDVEIHQYPSNPYGIYDTVVGISAGAGLDPTGAGSMDLSVVLGQPAPYVGQPNEGMYEGFAGITSITGAYPANHLYDLTGRIWRYSAVGAGAGGAFYIMDDYLPADPADP